MASAGWIDRIARSVSPRWALQRARDRAVLDVLERHYEAASTGRRTQGWKRSSGDANAALTGGALSRIRDHARNLVRNNPHALSGLSTITDHAVGWGIVPSTDDKKAERLWKEWAETTACDADGRNDIYGLEKLAMRTTAESGEALVRRRFRRPEDDLPIPMQLQVLEPDYLDTLKTGIRLPNGGRITQGVEFDAIGRRVAYWFFPEHPGSAEFFAGASQRVSAENVLHVYHQARPGQVRGVSWFAAVLPTLKQWDEYTDAQLMKQVIAACLSVILTDDGTGAAMGVKESQEDSSQPELDRIGAGTIHIAPVGREVTVVQPPSVGDFGPYAEVTLRTIATGLGVTYEDLTGDYSEMPYSAARMSRLRHWARVEGWRWQMLIPQFCAPVWDWFVEVGTIFGKVSENAAASWTAPPLPMIDPDKEGIAYGRLIRSGLRSLSEILRESGYDPRSVLNELAADFKMLDELKLVLDIDPRKMTQQGQFQSQPKEEPETVGQDMITLPKTAPKKAVGTNGAARK
jgi:lambda family phage portal protein